MKKLSTIQMEYLVAGKNVTTGCAMMGVAAMYASIGLGVGALVVGTFTYGGCLLLES